MCNFRLTLSMICLCRKMRHKGGRYEFFLLNRSLVCSCPWDRHARRLSLRDDPESHFKEDFTILFHKNLTQSRYFFVYLFSENHLFVAYFASACKVFFKDKSDFYHKDISRVYQKQNLALSWFKPASTLCSKYEWLCEFEKDLKVFRYGFSETIPIFFIGFSANILMFYIQKMNCVSHGFMAVRIDLKNLA